MSTTDDPTLDDYLTELEQRVQEIDHRTWRRPPAWKPSDSDPLIVGEIIALDFEEERSKPPTRVVCVRRPDGEERTIWVNTAMLRRGLTRLERDRGALRLGDLFAVHYRGERQGRNGGKPYKEIVCDAIYFAR